MYVLFINGRKIEVEQATLTGAQVRAIVALDPTADLIVEAQGAAADWPLSDDAILDLSSGPAHLFIRSATTFGTA